MISFGVPAGATTLCQMPRSKPGSVSPTVGISGAIESRLPPVRPRILILLSRQSGMATLALSMPSWMSPARMPVICVVPPL